MLGHSSHTEGDGQATRLVPDRSHVGRLQIVLWLVWTCAVVGTALVQWQRAVATQRAVNIVGLAIHAGTIGIIGLIVLTLIEMRLEPWRFWE